MRLDWAILCNHAEYPPNGLLYISGGGVDTIMRQQYPSPLMAALVVRVLASRAESDRPHAVEIQVNTVDGQSIVTEPARLTVGPLTVPPNLPTGWDVSANVVANLQGLSIARPGEYAIEILLDNQHVKTVHLRAVIPPAATQAPLGSS